MTYLRPLPRCLECGSAATEELCNTYNASQGVYCPRHAKRALARFIAAAKAREPAPSSMKGEE